MNNFLNELKGLINKYSEENKSNTPDFILVEYIAGCLLAFNTAVQLRETWYGRKEPQPICEETVLDERGT